MKRSKQVSKQAAHYREKGAALILMMFILGFALAAFIIKTFDTDSLKAQQEEKTMLALGQAKEALIAWSVSHPNWPGIMPFPDRRETSSPPNYDGKSDCVTSGLNQSHLIGMLPILGDSPCVSPQNGLGLQSYGVVNICESNATSCDPSGTRLWYAVSKNLIRTSGTASTPVINPGIINTAGPWLRVLDQNGNLVSDRVAAVIIAPGPAISSQNRSGSAPLPNNYLDQITIGGTTYSNFDYDSDDEDFIIGDVTTGTFNDRLTYITIDELMASIELRVAAEAREALQRYQTSVGRFPYAAPLGSAGNYSCVDATATGLLPLDSNPSNSCTCTSAQSCDCSFDIIDSVTFSRAGLAWDDNGGSCSRSGNNCTCTGAGFCSFFFGVVRFECDALGGCDSNSIPGAYTFTGVFENSNVNQVTGSCSHSCGSTTVSCNFGAGTFSSGNCGDPGIAPTIAVNTVAGSNQLITTSNFTTEQVQAGMHVIGLGIAESTVINSVTNATTLVMSRNATATGSANITFSRLPAWFEINSWQDYIYYAVSRDAVPTMTVGTKPGVQALLATTGRAINSVPFATSKGSAQVRVSCNVEDYLDSSENVSANQIYEATNKPKTLNYNDQLFIVSP